MVWGKVNSTSKEMTDWSQGWTDDDPKMTSRGENKKGARKTLNMYSQKQKKGKLSTAIYNELIVATLWRRNNCQVKMRIHETSRRRDHGTRREFDLFAAGLFRTNDFNLTFRWWCDSIFRITHLHRWSRVFSILQRNLQAPGREGHKLQEVYITRGVIILGHKFIVIRLKRKKV